MSSEDANSHTNLEIGRSLERARTERGLSLEQVEEATKIRARYLRDLERENFDVLPAVYVLGSLKTYVDFLGLDGEAISRQLKNRRESLQQGKAPTDEEPTKVERGGFLAAFGSLPVIGDRDALEDDEDVAVPVTVSGQSLRLYLGLGAVLILVLAVVFTTILGGGDQRAVSQVSEPVITDPPSRIAALGSVEDSKDDERNSDTDDKNARSEEQAESLNDKKEEGQAKESETDDEDNARWEAAGDVAINSLSPSTASASTASASTASASTASASTASASVSSTASASATSTPVATAPADAASVATAPTSDAPAVPENANPGVTPRPAAEPPAARPGAVPPGGPGQTAAGGLGRTRLADGIVIKVRKATAFAR
jgi:transcriptional regulator with XRE-family HTH domain